MITKPNDRQFLPFRKRRFGAGHMTRLEMNFLHMQRLLAMVIGIAIPNRDESNRLVQKSLPALFL